MFANFVRVQGRSRGKVGSGSSLEGGTPEIKTNAGYGYDCESVSLAKVSHVSESRGLLVRTYLQIILWNVIELDVGVLEQLQLIVFMVLDGVRVRVIVALWR